MSLLDIRKFDSLSLKSHLSSACLVLLLVLFCIKAKSITLHSASSSSDFTPVEVHLAFTQIPNQIVVSFHTLNYDEKLLGFPMIKFSHKDRTLKGEFQTATLGNVVTQYGEVSHTGYDFNVLLSNLEFDKLYYYQCTFTRNENVSSDIYHFHTRTDPQSPESYETTVISYGDQGILNSYYVMERVKDYISKFYNSSQKNLFVYHLGDISYADDYPGLIYQAVWSWYMNKMTSIMPYVSYMVLPGNHEMGPLHHPYYSFELGFQALNHRFFMPLRNNSNFGHNMWYSFEYGPITFVSISTETNYPENFFPEYVFKGDQLAWLEQTLAKIDRKRTPWVIVTGHRPIYSSAVGYSNSHGIPDGQSVPVQQAFEDLLVKYHVDIMLVGHVHSYERTYPVYKTLVERKDNFHNLRYPIHIVNGAGGCIEGLTWSFMYHWGINWSAHIYNKDEGYGILKTSFNPQSKIHSLTFSFYSAGENQLIDSVTITKDDL
ncbi:hypothetical protein C9374_009808 [Naegleria lovaniensis]|uniref:Purple acid phosphatase n=1 Tax=Naegleria lovaniensis TaxID=51637 RepID=A0AA88KRD7_NAELO|nr:uncharacterized protein C9374_009808 [Naegleria lovaniensis]KAG2393231.1 hypothetical protein C9374_009808 [Naegleria lovaniensis]